VTAFVGRARNGEAIGQERLVASELRKLEALVAEAEASKDLDTWRRAHCVLGYIDGRSVISMADALGINRTAITKWLSWYNAEGADGLRTSPRPGRAPRLTEEQRAEVVRVVEAGPIAAGFSSGVWVGALVGEWIDKRFGVRYHPQHIPRLLHQLGFSVQRPRKRLARADLEKQALWLRKTFPAIKKKPAPAEA
jgi:transposase